MLVNLCAAAIMEEPVMLFLFPDRGPDEKYISKLLCERREGRRGKRRAIKERTDFSSEYWLTYKHIHT